MRKDSGFTLIELMVAVAVLAIMLGVAVPSFSGMIKKNRRTTVINDLVTDIHVARSEAFGRNEKVVLCRGNGDAGSPACAAGATAWSTGWVAFVDSNDNGDFDGSAGDELIGFRAANPGSISVYSDADALTFRRFTGGSNATIQVCIDDDPDQARAIVLDRGRPRLSTKKGNNDALDCA